LRVAVAIPVVKVATGKAVQGTCTKKPPGPNETVAGRVIAGLLLDSVMVPATCATEFSEMKPKPEAGPWTEV
jgi:hypothetical protein